MTLNRVVFSSLSDHWSTPESIYNELNQEFNFDYDPCPLHSKEDGLLNDWGKRCFINPPYTRGQIESFIEKALLEIKKGNSEICVFLIPARTSNIWFHKYCLKKATEIRFIKGRLRFGNAKDKAPFPSVVVIFRKESLK